MSHYVGLYIHMSDLLEVIAPLAPRSTEEHQAVLLLGAPLPTPLGPPTPLSIFPGVQARLHAVDGVLGDTLWPWCLWMYQLTCLSFLCWPLIV